MSSMVLRVVVRFYLFGLMVWGLLGFKVSVKFLNSGFKYTYS